MALTDNKAKIQAILDIVNELPEAGSGEPTLQEKMVNPLTSAQTVKPDSGYDGLSQVIVNAMPTATQATPSINVSSGGLITASATQTAGFVSSGTKSATKQLTTQAAQTITPGASDKTIASGQYLTGVQTIKGDINLASENIAEGVSIFGVLGTLKAGGLPGNITALETGTVTIASDTTYENITHGLGVIPNFIAWVMKDDISAAVLSTAAFCGASFFKSAGTNSVHYMVRGYGSTGSGAGTTGSTSSTAYMTTTQARLVAHNSYKLLGGKKYCWVCGVIDGVL